MSLFDVMIHAGVGIVLFVAYVIELFRIRGRQPGRLARVKVRAVNDPRMLILAARRTVRRR